MSQAGNDGASVATTSASPKEDNGNGSIGNLGSGGDSKLMDSALSLIHKLQGDFGAQGKTTCRDCLRSKTLPCSRVVDIADGEFFFGLEKKDATTMNHSISPTQILEKAHQILLERFTNFLPPKNIPGETAGSSPSSLDCMNKVSVVLRFIQLMLLLYNRHREQSSALLFLSDGEINTMIVSLLKSWTHGVCELTRFCSRLVEPTQSETNHKDCCLRADATKNLQAGPVFCYAFYSLLRMNEYIQTRGALMVPLWKGLCGLTKLLVVDVSASEESSSDNVTQTEDHNNETNDWRDKLPPNLLSDVIRVVGDFMQEGKGRLEFEALQQYCKGKGPSQAQIAKIAFQGKFVGFMVTRMTQLLTIYFSFCETRGSEGMIDPIPNGVWRSLLGLRGMASALQLLRSGGLLTPTRQEIDASFLKVYCEIAAKVGKCVTDTLLRKHQKNRATLLPALESLLLSDMVKGGEDLPMDDDYHHHQEYQEEMRFKLIRMSALARTMGKVSALQQFLEIVTLESSSYAESVEPLLATIEQLLSSSIPQCLSACLIAVRCSKSRSVDSTAPTTIVLGSLKIMSQTLRKIEQSLEPRASPKRDAFYRLLVRWLAGKSGDSDKVSSNAENGWDIAAQEHPLSRELAVALLQAHIEGCSDNAGCGPMKLLSYMTTLLFDARTRILLRKNIGALFVRLQASQPSSVTCVLARKLIDREFIDWLNRSYTPRQGLSKKRKRRRGKHSVTGLSQQDVMVISRVLGTRWGAKAKSFSSPVSEEYQRVLRKEFTSLSSDCSEEASKSGKALIDFAERNSLLLAWLEGVVATDPTTSFQTFHQITGLDILVDIVRPVLTLVSAQRFKLGSNEKEVELLERQVILYSASMRLSIAWAVAFGDEGKLPIEKVCLLIKHSVSKDPWQQSNIEGSFLNLVEEQQSILKFEVMNLLGYIGKVIPSNCSERVLKVSTSWCFYHF